MSSQVVVDIVDASIVIPDTSTPDTGVFSVGQISDAGISNAVLPIIGVAIIILVLTVIILKLSIRRIKDKKRGSNFVIHHAGRSLLRLTSLVLMVAVSALVFYNYASIQKSADAVQLRASDTLSVTTEDIVIKVDMKDEPVFAMSKSSVKVDNATDNGYVLMAYIDSKNADLTNETDTSSKSKISGLESSYSQVLKENTWGVALAQPKDQDSPVFRGLPTSEEEAMTVKVTGSVATEANDEAVLYYATYITPDLDEGKYTGATINYVAVPNVTTDDITVRFNIYDEETDTSELFNTVTYGMDCAMAYVGSNCQKAYAGEPVVYETPSNLIMDSDEERYFHIEPISVVGADLLKIEVNVDDGDDNGDGFYDFLMIKGAYSSYNAVENAYSQAMRDYDTSFFLYRYSNNMIVRPSPIEFADTIYTENTAVTIALLTTQVGLGDYHVTVTPIYFEEPASIETTETSVCRIIENDSINSDWSIGNDIEHRAPDILSRISDKHVTIPGADRLRVEISYNLPPDTMMVEMMSGDWNLSNLSQGSNNIPEDILAVGGATGNESGIETFDFNGDTVTLFALVLSNNLPDVSDVWFSAKIYPLYESETENTVPTQTCRFVNKVGTYSDPPLFTYGDWSISLPTSDDGVASIRDEATMKMFLNTYREFYRGKVVDAYATMSVAVPDDPGSY